VKLFFVTVLVIFIGIWIAWAVYGKKHGMSRTIRWGGGFVLSMVGVAAFSVLVSKLMPDYALNSPSQIPKSSSINNVDDAKKFLVGTWTFTEPLNPNDAYFGNWEKWVIKEDGTVDVYSVSPTSDNWGRPESKEYEIQTSKYTDTGKRYYFIRIKNMALSANIVDDDLLGFTMSSSPPVPMRRGDKNPFSK